MPEYVVERYWPGVTDSAVRDVVDRLTTAAAAARSAGSAIRYLGSTLLPNDELVCCRFRAPGDSEVAELNASVGLRFDRIVLVHCFPER